MRNRSKLCLPHCRALTAVRRDTGRQGREEQGRGDVLPRTRSDGQLLREPNVRTGFREHAGTNHSWEPLGRHTDGLRTVRRLVPVQIRLRGQSEQGPRVLHVTVPRRVRQHEKNEQTKRWVQVKTFLLSIVGLVCA